MKTISLFTLALCCALLPAAARADSGYSATVKAFYAAVDAGDFEKAAAMLSENVKAYLPVAPQGLDKMGYKQLGMGFKAAFPDMKHQIFEWSETTGSVGFKGHFSGTNNGSLMGNPPTGNRVELPFLGYFKFDPAGKITEVNISFDGASMNAQLMAGIPSPAEANRAYAAKIIEGINQGKIDEVLAMYAPNCQFHGWGPTTVDVNGYKAAMMGLLASYPDRQLVPELFVAEGDYVVLRHRFEGTHTGVAFQGVPTSGKKVNIPSSVMFRFENGKPAELWLNADFLGMLMQIGGLEK